MAASHILHSFQCPIDQKIFLFSGGSLNQRANHLFPSSSRNSHRRIARLSPPRSSLRFNPWELLGGRGICNGEAGLEKELTFNKKSEEYNDANNQTKEGEPKEDSSAVSSFGIKEDAFEKELLGLTGGFPGGEKGLQKFIEENPPPKKAAGARNGVEVFNKEKPKAPELPMLMPGMIVIVKNQSNPFYMYSGILQRITDGKAGVLFEGGNWDRLVTFELGELERREKGPPMVSPKSAMFETMAEQ